MIDYNETAIEISGARNTGSGSQLGKRSFYGLKKEFDQYMMDGCKQSFSVVEGPKSDGGNDAASKEKASAFTNNAEREYKDKPLPQELIASNVTANGGQSGKVDQPASSMKNREALLKVDSSAVKIAHPQPENEDIRRSRQTQEKSRADAFIAQEDKSDSNVKIFLSEGEYILKINGNNQSLSLKDIHQYLEVLKRDYDFKISRAYVNNRLVYEQPDHPVEDHVGQNDYSSLNLYY